MLDAKADLQNALEPYLLAMVNTLTDEGREHVLEASDEGFRAKADAFDTAGFANDLGIV